jgi:2-polyprenyl-3-methyl-5-hydroxy-6-metoxy-1,4-benzoquinol methylase
MARSIDVSDPQYRERIAAALKEHYFGNRVAPGYLDGEEGRITLNDHLSGRFEIASKYVVPWIHQNFDLSGMTIIEVGSGTGSATLALAQVAKSVDCYEIHSGSVVLAEERLRFWGVDNVNFRQGLFDRHCEFVTSGGKADAIVFYAVLEHMTHEECLTVLELSWKILRSGGILVTAETPNRFSIIDEHTSWLPFFSQLPRSIQILYAANSPREEFRWAIAEAAKSGTESALESMTRWGSGISFHEFELAIGKNIHDFIVLDGYEDEITRLCPMSAIDRALQSLFAEFKIQAHRAFSRRHLYFVAQKP